MGKIKVIHLFSGVGSPEMALKKLGLPVEFIGFSEIDKYAIQSYRAIHGYDIPNLGSVTDIKRLPQCNLLVYGSPCQDFSIAGLQKGLVDKEGNQTRSGLLLEVERLLEVAKDNNELPNVLLMENVKNLVSKKFKPDFDIWLNKLEELGYVNYWQVLNAKDYEIPQNRERVFVVSILKGEDEGYKFPDKMPLVKILKDILEEKVDEKFYLSDKMTKIFIENSLNNEAKGNGFRFKPHNPTKADVSFALTTRCGGRMDDNFVLDKELNDKPYFQFDKDNTDKVIQIGNIVNTGNWDNPQRGRIYSADGISPTLSCMQGGGLEPKIIIETKSFINNKYNKFYNSKGYIPEMFNPYNCMEITELAPTQTTFCGSTTNSSTVLKLENLRIRKLTPKECWRLMGFDDVDFDKAQASGVSNSQLYKQAGNSIVVNVLYHIFRELYL